MMISSPVFLLQADFYKGRNLEHLTKLSLPGLTGQSSMLDSRRSDRTVPDDRAADRRLTDWRFRGDDMGFC